MLDLFRILKIDYREYIILFKSGSFYISFDEDSIILNKLFNYKIVELKNNIKVGFPINKLDLVINRLKEEDINYLVIEDKIIANEYKSLDNHFRNYSSNIFNIISIISRINKITSKLKEMYNNENIDSILNEIEKILKTTKFNN